MMSLSGEQCLVVSLLWYIFFSSVGAACLTTDDLIPLLVTVIVQSRCGQIASNIFYLENFNWSGSCKDDLR